MQSKVVVVGPFPPPVHGMAKNTLNFYKDISKKAEAKKIDISPGSLNRGYSYHLNKLGKVINGYCKLFWMLCTKRVASLYSPPDAGLGAYYTVGFVCLARLFGIPIYLHHRSFAYINKKTIGMRLIVFIAGRSATHIYLCNKMKDGFELKYGANENSMIVSNAQYVVPVKHPSEPSESFVIGHLSNLGYGKGLKQVFDVLRKALAAGNNVSLELAGPTENQEIEDYLQECLSEFGNTVRYHGLVGEKEKSSFYSKLDLFLFPSQYENEAQPNVLFEANSYAIPVAAIQVGCVLGDVDERNGFTFPDQESYVNGCVEIIKNLDANRNELASLKVEALKRITKDATNAKKAYLDLLDKVAGWTFK